MQNSNGFWRNLVVVTLGALFALGFLGCKSGMSGGGGDVGDACDEDNPCAVPLVCGEDGTCRYRLDGHVEDDGAVEDAGEDDGQVYSPPRIEFDENGRWDCSFKDSDFPEDLDQTDSIPIDGVYFYSSTWTTSPCGDNQSGIYAYGNHQAGEGDRAYRYALSDGVNQNATPLTILFPYSPEVWVRFYIKWEEGFRWEYLNYQKLLSFFTHNSDMYHVLGVNWENRISLTPKIDDSSEWVKGEGGGWGYMFGDAASGESNAYSDGSWQTIEVYARMNSATGVFDGEAAIWVNGNLIIRETSVRWDEGSETDLMGFSRFSFGLNQREPGNENGPLGRSCSYTYFDDIVIYNQTPPNTDEHGNPFIGPIGLE